MNAYRHEGKILCYECFKRIAEKEPESGDVIDGNEFVREFGYDLVECQGVRDDKCIMVFDYHKMTTTTEDSLGR